MMSITSPEITYIPIGSRLDASETSPEQIAQRKMAQAEALYATPSLFTRSSLGRHRTQFWWSLRLFLLRNATRVFDLAISGLALAIAVPIMLITAIAIKIDSRGPIFFTQTRVGKWGETFKCYKFRSMFIDAEERKAELLALNEIEGPMFKMTNDPRVTRVGKIIRALSIDELPQLINVIRGDMSLVGPRPPLPDEVAVYNLDYLRRLGTTPGITGLPQVSGRSTLHTDRWIELDLKFIAEQGIRQYIVILLLTIPAVLFRRGAY